MKLLFFGRKPIYVHLVPILLRWMREREKIPIEWNWIEWNCVQNKKERKHMKKNTLAHRKCMNLIAIQTIENQAEYFPISFLFVYILLNILTAKHSNAIFKFKKYWMERHFLEWNCVSSGNRNYKDKKQLQTHIYCIAPCVLCYWINALKFKHFGKLIEGTKNILKPK